MIQDMFGEPIIVGDIIGFLYGSGTENRIFFGEVISIVESSTNPANLHGPKAPPIRVLMPDRGMFAGGIKKLEWPHDGTGYVTNTTLKSPRKAFKTDWNPSEFWSRFGIKR